MPPKLTVGRAITLTWRRAKRAVRSIPWIWESNVYRLKYYLANKDDRRLVVIACFPKSGSTFLMRFLCQCTGFPRAILTEFMGPNEQDFCEHNLRRFRYRNAICQQHLKGTSNNVRLAQEYRLGVVILVRNIFDVVVSACDHLYKGGPELPTGYAPPWFWECDETERWRFFIRVHLPWYFNFLMSWQESENEIPVMWVSYEQLFADEVANALDISQFCDLGLREVDIRRALDAMPNVETRLNQGISGRGKSLPDEHQQAVYELARQSRLSPKIAELVGLNQQVTSGSAETVLHDECPNPDSSARPTREVP